MSDRAIPAATVTERDERIGIVLVVLSALVWSSGGTIARFIEVDDNWTIVFWRSLWAAIFLLGFMIWRDGLIGTMRLFRGMGIAGIVVGSCFAIASSTFVVALSYTTVANIMLILAGVPLIAALISWLVFRDRVSGPTWCAIGAVIVGVGVMVSESFGGAVSPVGDTLAIVNAFAFAIATVITRRYASVRMTPATCLGAILAAIFAVTQVSSLTVSATNMGLLFAFGALNLGFGLALFASGARLVPSALAALLGTLETILSPVWVWLVHGEIPSQRAILGGAIIVTALMVHLGLQFRRPSKPAKPGVTGVQTPQ